MVRPPEPRDFAERLLERMLDRLEGWCGAALAAFDEPVAGSVAADDLAYVMSADTPKELGTLRLWARRAASYKLAASREQLLGLQRLLVGGGELLPLPALTTSRSAVDAALQVWWLFDPDASRDERIARWGAQLVHDLQEPPKTLDLFDGGAVRAEADRIQGGREDAQALLERAGFKLKLKGAPLDYEASLVSYGDAKSDLQAVKMGALMEDFFTIGGAAFWATTSGAVHSRTWLLVGLDSDVWTLFGSILMPLFDAADGFTGATGTYLGLDDAAQRKRAHVWRAAMLGYVKPDSGPHVGYEGYARRSAELAQDRQSPT